MDGAIYMVANAHKYINQESLSVGRTRLHQVLNFKQDRGANHYTTTLGPGIVVITLFFCRIPCNDLSEIVFDTASELFVVLTL
jgi:hypothetical protein